MLNAHLIYWLLAVCTTASFGVIAFSWERMRRLVNQALPAEKRLPFYPLLPHATLNFGAKPANFGHFVTILDKYGELYPSSSLPRKVASGVVIWILCFMALLASGVGR